MRRWLFGTFLIVLTGFGCKAPADLVPQEGSGDTPSSPAVITMPEEGASVSSPFTLSGSIKADPSVSYEWFINEGKSGELTGLIPLGTVDANGYAPYSVQIFLPVPFPVCTSTPCSENATTTDSFEVDVRTRGGEILDHRTLHWQDATGKTSVSLFFVDEGDGDTCAASGYEKRTFARTNQIAELALTELLRGSQKKMRTEIPEGTTLASYALDADGVAHVDFASENEARWSGGSCHVGLIRSQITQTLLQIDGVKDVVVTVNGKGDADGILQP